MPFGILVADEEPGRDQRVDKSRLCRRSGDFGERGRARRNGLLAQAHRGEGAQHRRQCLLDIGRERVDHFVGAPRDRTFKAAKRPIGSKGEQPTVSAGLVERVEHKFEKRQRSGIGNSRLLQHILQPALIGSLLEAQARRRAPARG